MAYSGIIKQEGGGGGEAKIEKSSSNVGGVACGRTIAGVCVLTGSNNGGSEIGKSARR